MARKDDKLKVVAPDPVDERSPLLGEQQPSENGTLEAQAEQERREHDAGTVPIAEEPSLGKLSSTMGALWVMTFFVSLIITLHRHNDLLELVTDTFACDHHSPQCSQAPRDAYVARPTPAQCRCSALSAQHAHCVLTSTREAPVSREYLEIPRVGGPR